MKARVARERFVYDKPDSELNESLLKFKAAGFHEAGHVVCAYLRGLSIKKMCWVFWGLAGAKVWYTGYCSDFYAASIALAGPLAQLQFCPASVSEQYRASLSKSLVETLGDQPAFEEFERLGWCNDIRKIIGFADYGVDLEKVEQRVKRDLQEPDAQLAIRNLAYEFLGRNSIMSGKVAERIIQESLDWRSRAPRLS